MKRAVLVVLGAYLFVLGAFVHRHVGFVGEIPLPWGLVLVVAVTYVMTFAAGRVIRIGGAWFAVGWALGLLAMQYSPSGSYLIASDWLGWTFTAGCLGAVVAGVIRPPSIAK